MRPKLCDAIRSSKKGGRFSGIDWPWSCDVTPSPSAARIGGKGGTPLTPAPDFDVRETMPELRLKHDNTKAFTEELFGEGVKGLIGDFLWKFKQDTIGVRG